MIGPFGRHLLQDATRRLNDALAKDDAHATARWLAMGSYYLGFLHGNGGMTHGAYPFQETDNDLDSARFLSALNRAMSKDEK